MNIRRFRALRDAGATCVEIGRECGCDWRTVKKYLKIEESVNRLWTGIALQLSQTG